jgi:hypothetical protein
MAPVPETITDPNEARLWRDIARLFEDYAHSAGVSLEEGREVDVGDEQPRREVVRDPLDALSSHEGVGPLRAVDVRFIVKKFETLKRKCRLMI